MAVMPKVAPARDDDAEARRRAEQSTRDEHGIQELAADEELIDEATFSQVQHVMTRAREEAGGGLPDGVLTEEIGVALEEVPLDEVLLDDIIAELSPTDPSEVATAEARIRAAADRDELADLCLLLARVHARAAALFVVHRGMIMGLRGSGDDLERRALGVMIPADSPSLFATIASGGKPRRCGDVVHPIDRQVLHALGRSEARDRLIVPVTIRGRVVNLLYADNGADPLGATSAAALAALGQLVAQSYERLILQRKSGDS